MFVSKLGFLAVLSSAVSLLFCRIVVRQISKALQTGQWRTRSGVIDRLTSPKAFWFALLFVSGFAIVFVAMVVFLIVAALTSH